MAEMRKTPSKNTVIFVSFVLSLVCMGIITLGVSLGYINFDDQGSSTETSLGDPSKNCPEIQGCYENAPLDRSAVEQ